MQLICKKVLPHSSLEPSLEYSQDQMPLPNQDSLILEQKTGKEMPELSRLEFLEKFLTNNFAFSDAEDNTSGLLSRGGIAVLPLLRRLLAIYQMLHKPSFWGVMHSVLLAYASLAASRTLLQHLVACGNFTLEAKD